MYRELPFSTVSFLQRYFKDLDNVLGTNAAFYKLRKQLFFEVYAKVLYREGLF